jgi:hypothetical protein
MRALSAWVDVRRSVRVAVDGSLLTTHAHCNARARHCHPANAPFLTQNFSRCAQSFQRKCLCALVMLRLLAPYVSKPAILQVLASAGPPEISGSD